MKKFDSSYDRGQAVNLAAVLTGKKTRIDMPQPGQKATDHTVPTSQIQYPKTPDVGFRDEGAYRDQIWKALLGWALETSSSQWGYVCDDSGLVIAESGQAPDTGEVIPSIVVSALDKLKRCSAESELPKILALKSGDLWITALIFRGDAAHPESEGLVIGLTGPNSPHPQTLEHVGQIFKEKIAAS